MQRVINLLIFTLLAILVLSFNVFSADRPDVRQIVEKVDKLYRGKTSRGSVEMTVVSENWTRTLKMDVWSEGFDKTFIHITYPKKDAGISTLRIKNEMWNYFPRINKVMKVPPSMMMSSWMGSDFTNDDLVKESSMLRDYHSRLVDLERGEPGLYYIELVPKRETPSVWGKILITVREKDLLPVREEYYNEKGIKMRVMELKEIKTFGSRRIPSVLELVPLNKQGSRTVIRYTDLSFDIKLDNDLFTLRNLQKTR